jgi:hypothetical protein
MPMDYLRADTANFDSEGLALLKIRLSGYIAC